MVRDSSMRWTERVCPARRAALFLKRWAVAFGCRKQHAGVGSGRWQTASSSAGPVVFRRRLRRRPRDSVRVQSSQGDRNGCACSDVDSAQTNVDARSDRHSASDAPAGSRRRHRGALNRVLAGTSRSHGQGRSPARSVMPLSCKATAVQQRSRMPAVAARPVDRPGRNLPRLGGRRPDRKAEQGHGACRGHRAHWRCHCV